MLEIAAFALDQTQIFKEVGARLAIAAFLDRFLELGNRRLIIAAIGGCQGEIAELAGLPGDLVFLLGALETLL